MDLGQRRARGLKEVSGRRRLAGTIESDDDAFERDDEVLGTHGGGACSKDGADVRACEWWLVK